MAQNLSEFVDLIDLFIIVLWLFSDSEEEDDYGNDDMLHAPMPVGGKKKIHPTKKVTRVSWFAFPYYNWYPSYVHFIYININLFRIIF